MVTAKNIVEKIWDSHVVLQRDRHPAIFAIDLMLLHEVTSAQAFDVLREQKLLPFDTKRLIATLDHSIPTRKNRFEIFDDAARKQVELLRENCKEFGITLYDFESGYQGIVHIIGPELGLTQPGMTLVCGDSHTSTHGAFGALAFGVGTSEVGHVMATGSLLMKKPKSMEVVFNGTFPPGVYSKDAILALIAKIGIAGGTGHVLEYRGQAVSQMSMEERMTLCNMSIECGARAGLISPDNVTFEYLKGRRYAPKGEHWEHACEYWRSIATDTGARFDSTVDISCSALRPMVTWGINPEHAISIEDRIPSLEDFSEPHQPIARKAFEYTGLQGGRPILGTPIDWAFLGSCTNGRIEDLRVAASIIKGKKVSDKVTFFVVPGSELVRRQAMEEGLDRVFEEAGAQFRMPGCSMCLGMNDDLVPSGKRCISSSNRNFIGRQGPGSITHLASPATVAASAIEGKITSPEQYL